MIRLIWAAYWHRLAIKLAEEVILSFGMLSLVVRYKDEIIGLVIIPLVQQEGPSFVFKDYIISMDYPRLHSLWGYSIKRG